jgi:hypothetical protein
MHADKHIYIFFLFLMGLIILKEVDSNQTNIRIAVIDGSSPPFSSLLLLFMENVMYYTIKKGQLSDLHMCLQNVMMQLRIHHK